MDLFPRKSSDGDTALLNHPHNYYNKPPSNAWKVSIADWVGLSIAFILVAVRCYTRFKIKRSSGWEDYTLILALLGLIGFVTCNAVQRFQYGGGRHTWDEPPENYNGYLRTGATATYLYVLGIMFAKLSLLLFLYRIFKVDIKWRVAAWLVGFVLVVWSVLTLLLCIFGCRPLGGAWDVNLILEHKVYCSVQSYNAITMQGICNIITDFALLLLPMPMLWKLQMTPKKRIGVALVFATGLSICTIATVRQYILFVTPKAGDNWLATKNIMWMSLEFSFSIIVANLPALTPLLKRANLSCLLPSSLRARSSHGSTSQRALWPKRLLDPTPDVERGVLDDGPGAWKIPRAWKNAEKRTFGDYYDVRSSENSERTLQSAQLVYHVPSRTPSSNQL